ncbi:MAG: hypothetical protein AB7U73_25670 [Pirellulales bacterium]
MTPRFENILALDLSLHTGWAHSAGWHGVWHLAARGSEHAGRRLVRLENNLRLIGQTHPIDLVAYEDSSQQTRGQAARLLHGMLVGIVQKFAAERDVPFRALGVSEVKALAGGGAYSKAEMIRAAQLKLGEAVRDDNEADALWVLTLAQLDLAAEARRRERRRTGGKPQQRAFL